MLKVCYYGIQGEHTVTTVYVTGHRNPDADSVCAAYCYADLKNTVDTTHEYIPIRLGHMNEGTKTQFEHAGVEPPRFLKDVKPRVHQVMMSDYWALHPEDPVYSLIRYLRKNHASVVPLLDGEKFHGLLSLDEITMYFLMENSKTRPRYHFHVSNFADVIQGELIQGDPSSAFNAYIMTGAMELEVYQERLKQMLPDLPLLVVGNRREHIQFAVEQQFPAVILTGIKDGEEVGVDFSSFKGVVYRSAHDTAETIRLLRLSLPVADLVSEAPPHVQRDELFDEAKQILVNSNFRGLPVFEEGKFVGFVTRRCFLEKPRPKVIMVDHNELKQSVEGLEEGDVMEIIDHHRFDAERTKNPIFIASEPVGSSCTIVYHQYLRWTVPVKKEIAFLLLTGIVSDTIMLKSPTTTQMDVRAVHALAPLAGVEDLEEFANEIFSNSVVLSDADPKSVIEGDFKIYREGNVSFGIGQVEVLRLADANDVKEKFLSELTRVRDAHHVDWTLLLITDVKKGNSLLITTPFLKDEKAFSYPLISDHMYQLNGVLSRKKQVLPEIVRVLEEMS